MGRKSTLATFHILNLAQQTTQTQQGTKLQNMARNFLLWVGNHQHWESLKKTQLFFLEHQRAEGAGNGSDLKIQWKESCKCFPALTSIWSVSCIEQILFARKRFSTQREFGHWNRLPSSEPQAWGSSGAFGQSSQACEGIFGVSCERQEFYSMILVGPFLPRIF